MRLWSCPGGLSYPIGIWVSVPTGARVQCQDSDGSATHRPIRETIFTTPRSPRAQPHSHRPDGKLWGGCLGRAILQSVKSGNAATSRRLDHNTERSHTFTWSRMWAAAFASCWAAVFGGIQTGACSEFVLRCRFHRRTNNQFLTCMSEQ